MSEIWLTSINVVKICFHYSCQLLVDVDGNGRVCFTMKFITTLNGQINRQVSYCPSLTCYHKLFERTIMTRLDLDKKFLMGLTRNGQGTNPDIRYSMPSILKIKFLYVRMLK